MAIRKRGYRRGSKPGNVTARTARHHQTSSGRRSMSVTRFPRDWYRMSSGEALAALSGGPMTPKRRLAKRGRARAVNPAKRVLRFLGYYGSSR